MVVARGLRGVLRVFYHEAFNDLDLPQGLLQTHDALCLVAEPGFVQDRLDLEAEFLNPLVTVLEALEVVGHVLGEALGPLQGLLVDALVAVAYVGRVEERLQVLQRLGDVSERELPLPATALAQYVFDSALNEEGPLLDLPHDVGREAARLGHGGDEADSTAHDPLPRRHLLQHLLHVRLGRCQELLVDADVLAPLDEGDEVLREFLHLQPRHGRGVDLHQFPKLLLAEPAPQVGHVSRRAHDAAQEVRVPHLELELLRQRLEPGPGARVQETLVSAALLALEVAEQPLQLLDLEVYLVAGCGQRPLDHEGELLLGLQARLLLEEQPRQEPPPRGGRLLQFLPQLARSLLLVAPLQLCDPRALVVPAAVQGPRFVVVGRHFRPVVLSRLHTRARRAGIRPR
mmetsp:Transcript_23350/g.65350  ORF Transcript_23350/g.65350 Transcript_23350/m.65350 type:complete len:401 (+) Transcript_23350:514-1716(+)